MPELLNKIGVTDSLNKYLARMGEKIVDSPIEMENGRIFVKFDAIEIVDASKSPTPITGVLIGYMWKGKPMLIMHQPKYDAPKNQVLNISGIDGRQEIQFKK